MQTAQEAAEQFFGDLLATAPEEWHSLLWTMPDKRSLWYSLNESPERVAASALELERNERDVYAAVSAARRPGRSNQRISSADSAGIFGLWADLDIAAMDIHRKWNLPPDQDAALELLERAGLEPTLVVHSGHGLQAWWLFKEFWNFQDETDRTEAGQLAERWNNTLRVRAAERGWTVDSTYDLARVMRVPGTTNRKGEPVTVTLITSGGPRYSPEDVMERVVDDSVLRGVGLTPSQEYVPDDVTLRRDAEPPFDKFQALAEADPTFLASWNHKRRDFHDQSASAYDMSLAAIAVRASWEDQEIVDLLLAHRRKHGEDLHLGRTDKYTRTVGKARDTVDAVDASEALDEAVEDLKSAQASGDDDEVRDRRREAMGTIGRQLGLEIQRIIKYLSDPPTFAMVTPTHVIDLGDVRGVLNANNLLASVAAATGHMIPRYRQGQWDRIAQAMLDSCEEQDVGMEATDAGQVYVWLTEYLFSRPPLDDLEEAVIGDYPYRNGADIRVFARSLRQWLWASRGERVEPRRLGRLLRSFGCTPMKMNITVEGTRTSRQAWALPPSLTEGGSWE